MAASRTTRKKGGSRKSGGAKKRATTKRKSSSKRKGARGKARPGPMEAALARLEAELPKTLSQFSRVVRGRLSDVEREIARAEVRTRRELTRLLREASHQLGRFEAEGERRWRELTTQARRDAVRTLRRLERALDPRRGGDDRDD